MVLENITSLLPESLMPYSDIILALLYIVVFVVAAKVINIFLTRYASRIAAKTKTRLDDMLLNVVRKMLLLGFFLFGLFSALGSINAIEPHKQTLDVAFTLLFGLYGALFAIRLGTTVLDWYGAEIVKKTKSKDEQLVPILKKVVYLVFGLIALMWILGQLGVEVTSIVATLGIGGLAIALALQPTLSNFFAGAYLMADRPIRIGDYIELDSGDTGYVEDIGMRTTKLRSWDGNLIIIPNDKVASSRIIDYESPNTQMMIKIPCGVGYGEDLEKVEKTAIDVAKKVMKATKLGVQEFDPIVRFFEFGESNINFNVLMKVNRRIDKFPLIHEYIKALKKEFDSKGIEIAWPMRKLHFDEKQLEKLVKPKGK